MEPKVIKISKSVTQLNAQDFKGNEIIEIEDSHPVFSFFDGILFNKETKTLVAYFYSEEHIEYTDLDDDYPVDENLKAEGTEDPGKNNKSASVFPFKIDDSKNELPRKNLETYRIPSEVEIIGDYAFCGSPLQVVILPQSVKKIGNAAFLQCESLREIKISSSVTSIGSNAFAACSSLERIEIPNSVTFLGSQAFSCCYKLKEVKLSENLKQIEAGLFYKCSLKNLVIPKSVQSIVAREISDTNKPNDYSLLDTFLYCGLKELEIPNTVTYIDGFILHYLEEDDCHPSLIIRDDHPVFQLKSDCVIHKKTNMLLGCYNMTKKKRLKIPNGTVGIEKTAFIYGEELKEIAIPASVSSIDDKSFVNSSDITFLVWDNSYAHEYVKANNLSYKIISE